MSAEQLVAELRAQLAASQAQAAARDAELAARDETLRHERQDRDSLRASLAVPQRLLAERDELLAHVAEVERDRATTQEHAALLLHAIRVAKRVPTLVDILGIVAAAGFKTEAVPHAALNKGMWRGDVLLIGALRNFPRAKDGATRLHLASWRGWVERITQLVVERSRRSTSGASRRHTGRVDGASLRRRRSSCGAAPRSRPGLRIAGRR